MDKYKVLVISVIVLAVVNLATLGFMWAKKPPRMKQQAMMCCKSEKNHHKKGEKHKKECNNEQCHKERGNKGENRKGPMSGKIIGERLNFSAEQQAKLKTIEEAHFTEIKEFKTKKRALKKELIGLLKSDSNTESKSNLIAQNAELENEILLSKMNHFSELKSLCIPEQLEGFYKLIEEMENKMHHKGKK